MNNEGAQAAKLAHQIYATGYSGNLKASIRMKKVKSSVIFHNFHELPYITAVTGIIVRNEFPAHTHDSLCLGISLKGERIIRTDNKEILIRQNGLFLIPPQTPHSCSAGQKSEHSYRILVIKPEFINMVHAETSSDKNENPAFELSWIEDYFLKELLEDFFDCLDTGKDMLKISEIIYEIAARLCIEHALFKNVFKEPVPGESSVKRAVEYLEKNWDQLILLEKLGKEAGMSPYHLLRVFRRIIGITPHAFLLHIRIKKTVDFLSKGIPPADVAAMTGFTDQSHFTKVFRRQVGVTPGLFQENNKI